MCFTVLEIWTRPSTLDRPANGVLAAVTSAIRNSTWATAALLLAPKTGREMREQLLKSLEESREAAKERSGDMARMAGEAKRTASEKWIELRGAGDDFAKGKTEPSGNHLFNLGGRRLD